MTKIDLQKIINLAEKFDNEIKKELRECGWLCLGISFYIVLMSMYICVIDINLFIIIISFIPILISFVLIRNKYKSAFCKQLQLSKMIIFIDEAIRLFSNDKMFIKYNEYRLNTISLAFKLR